MTAQDVKIISQILFEWSISPPKTQEEIYETLQRKMNVSKKEINTKGRKERIILARQAVALGLHYYLGKNNLEISEELPLEPETIRIHTLPKAIQLLNTEREKQGKTPASLNGQKNGTLKEVLTGSIKDQEEQVVNIIQNISREKILTKKTIDTYVEGKTGIPLERILSLRGTTGTSEEHFNETCVRDAVFYMYNLFLGMPYSKISQFTKGLTPSNIGYCVRNIEAILSSRKVSISEIDKRGNYVAEYVAEILKDIYSYPLQEREKTIKELLEKKSNCSSDQFTTHLSEGYYFLLETVLGLTPPTIAQRTKQNRTTVIHALKRMRKSFSEYMQPDLFN